MREREELCALYEKHAEDFTRIAGKHKDAGLHGPLLLYPKEEYFKQKVKFMVIGQEVPGGWDNIRLGIDELMEYYNIHYPAPHEKSGSTLREGSCVPLERELGIAEYSCMWCNIHRYSQDKTENTHGDKKAGSPNQEILDSMNCLNNLLGEEVCVLKPDVVVFCTGPDEQYESIVDRCFTNVQREPISNRSTRVLCRLAHPSLPLRSFRAYHPNGMRSIKRWGISKWDIMKAIAEN